MGYWEMIAEVGWYNAAAKIINIVLLPSFLISQGFYPVLSRNFQDSKEQFQRIWNYQMKIKMAFVLPLIIGGVILAPKIIDFIYGRDFLPSVLAFQILIIASGMSYLNSLFAQILVVSHQPRKLLGIILLGAIFNFILNLLLIPKLSFYGAALSFLITSFLIFSFFWGTVRQFK